MKEEHLFTGPLEPTNQPYAVAKLSGIVQCEAYNRQYKTRFLAVMPTNLYGPNDNYDLQSSHVLPALIRKFHLAKLAVKGDWDGILKDESLFGPIPEDFRSSLFLISEENGHYPSPQRHNVQKSEKIDSSDNRRSPVPAVPIWGTGRSRREFLHADDMADACIFLINLDNSAFDRLLAGSSESPSKAAQLPLINMGSSEDQTIRELAFQIAKIVGYSGEMIWDQTKPDGMPKKLLDTSRLDRLGWNLSISLTDGIKNTYEWYLDQAGSP